MCCVGLMQHSAMDFCIGESSDSRDDTSQPKMGRLSLRQPLGRRADGNQNEWGHYPFVNSEDVANPNHSRQLISHTNSVQSGDVPWKHAHTSNKTMNTNDMKRHMTKLMYHNNINNCNNKRIRLNMSVTV